MDWISASIEARDELILIAWQRFHVSIAGAVELGVRQSDIALRCGVTRETVRLWTKQGRQIIKDRGL